MRSNFEIQGYVFNLMKFYSNFTHVPIWKVFYNNCEIIKLAMYDGRWILNLYTYNPIMIGSVVIINPNGCSKACETKVVALDHILNLISNGIIK